MNTEVHALCGGVETMARSARRVTLSNIAYGRHNVYGIA